MERKETSMNIEKHIAGLKGNRNNYKISVVLYDPYYNNYHFICKISRPQDECLMCSTVIFPKELQEQIGFADLDYFYLSDLNEQFGHCIIDETSQYIGLHYKEVEKQLTLQKQV